MGALTSLTRPRTSRPNVVTSSPASPRSSKRAFCLKENMSTEERLAFHQAKSAPIMTALERWMRAELDEPTRSSRTLDSAARSVTSSNAGTSSPCFYVSPERRSRNNMCGEDFERCDSSSQQLALLPQRAGRAPSATSSWPSFIPRSSTARTRRVPRRVLQHEHDVAADPDAWLPWNYRTALAARESPAVRGWTLRINV